MFGDSFSAAVKLGDAFIALGIFAAALLIALLVRWLLRHLEKRAKATSTTLDDLLLSALATPLSVAIALLGLYFGALYLPFDAELDAQIHDWFLVALVGDGIYAGLAMLDAFYRWYAREVAASTKTTLDDRLVAVLRVGTPLIGGFLGVLLLARMLGIKSDPINNWLVTHGISIAIMLVFFLLTFFGVSRGLPRVVKDTVRKGMVGQPEEEVQKRAETLAGVLVTTSQVSIIGAAALMVLNELLPGRIAPLLAGVGVAGIAIGFGAQSLVKDVITGIFVIMEGQYHVGDWIGIAGIDGQVENVNLRRTVLRDRDGAVHFVPNGEIKVASNFTKGFSRVNLDVSVSYSTDLDHAIEVINRVGKKLGEDPKWSVCIVKPPQALRVQSLGESGIDIKVTGETRPMKQWDVMGELLKRIKEAFDAEGIEIPFPTRKVFVEKASGLAPHVASAPVSTPEPPDGSRG